ncbi:hypothetical protein GGF46_000112 [Coemansia sp. RSA 552]|nr:hypothetical protein GGF46_000112 [Coemansia sp. RSA 552]
MAAINLQGTGTGTLYPAATDVAKEPGVKVFGGVELIDDPSSPAYIGHGVAHRDPTTGAPLDASVHIPTRGELHPEEFAVTAAPADAAGATDLELLERKYNISSPGKYHANWYKTKSIVHSLLGKLTGSKKHMDKAAKQSDLATLELSAFSEASGGYSFAKA